MGRYYSRNRSIKQTKCRNGWCCCILLFATFAFFFGCAIFIAYVAYTVFKARIVLYSSVAIIMCGVLLLLCGPYLLVKLCPISCGHRKIIFTGSSSKSLQTILLSIDSYLPTMAERNQLKDDALAFFSDIKTALDNKFAEAPFECIFSGSIEERFGIPCSHKNGLPSQLDALYSDFDMMFCCDAYSASFGYTGNVHIDEPLMSEGYIVLLGFARLKKSLAHSSDQAEQLLDSKEFLKNVHNAVQSCKVEHLPSDHSLCCGCYDDPIETTIQGPAVKVSLLSGKKKSGFEGDITVCVKCLEWPTISDWLTREGRSWPTMENVQRIASLGCHLVAKPFRYKKENLPAWRFSFSVAEVELSKLVPDTARKCFLALKVIMKGHLQPVLPELSSYQIKTILYNALEKKQENFWVVENIEECFRTLLEELHGTLKSGYCQHFWLKGVNLFQDYSVKMNIFETKRKTLLLLATKVKRIQENPAPFIYDDGCCCMCFCCRCRCFGLESHITVVDGDADVCREQDIRVNVSSV